MEQEYKCNSLLMLSFFKLKLNVRPCLSSQKRGRYKDVFFSDFELKFVVITVSEHFAFAEITNTTGNNKRPLTNVYAFHTISHVYFNDVPKSLCLFIKYYFYHHVKHQNWFHRHKSPVNT